MEKQTFFKTKAGKLTLSFIVIVISVVIILAGLYAEVDSLCTVGFVLMMAAMLYSPVDTYILGKK